MSTSVTISAFLFILASTALAQTCSKTFTFNRNYTFATCVDLKSQQAALAWSYNSTGSTLSVVFSGVAPSPNGWVGWGLNFDGSGMIGTNALIAFQAANGSNMLDYKLTAQTQGNVPLQCTPIDMEVLDRAVDIRGDNVNMFAVIRLPNVSSVRHVWNRGSQVSNFQPQQHSLDSEGLSGRGNLNVVIGTVTSSGVAHQKLKNAHGFINAVGWGILLPIGVMSARYLRVFHDRAWFFLHIFCQASGYVLGAIGWGIGLRLGSYSKGIVHRSHRNIGITLFVFGTLQVLAIILRPGLDHKLRPYWKVYHHTIGYFTLLLAFINIYKGLDILEPENKWKKAYTGILVVLAVIAVILEVVTWVIYLKKRKADSEGKRQGVTNGRRQDGVEL